MRPHAVALIALAALALDGAAAAHAALPGANGLIVYNDTVGGHTQLFTIRPDGTGARQVTHFTDSDSLNAAWSPDSSGLVFERDFADRAGIFTMRLDGTGLRALTPTGLQGMPAYSPDGRLIVFDRTLPTEDALWIINANGSGLRQLTHNPPSGDDQCLCDGSPEFSPDGRRVAYVHALDGRSNAVLSIRVDGRGIRQLTATPGTVGGKLDWSPDGRRLVISQPGFGASGGRSANVFTISRQGTSPFALTTDQGGTVNNGADSFSPDGRRIAFISNRNESYQLYTMTIVGTDIRQLTHGTDVHWANWGSHR